MRRTVQSMDFARDLASIVLPTPGTSSMSRWPSASSTVTAVRTTSGFPSMTDVIASVILRTSARTSASASGVLR